MGNCVRVRSHGGGDCDDDGDYGGAAGPEERSCSAPIEWNCGLVYQLYRRRNRRELVDPPARNQKKNLLCDSFSPLSAVYAGAAITIDVGMDGYVLKIWLTHI